METKGRDCSDELSDGTFTLIKILLIDFFKIPIDAIVPLGIVLVLFGLFLIFLKPIREKLSPEKEEWNNPDEEA
jgi:ABC-type bacteriocin/lantibiotic exporter with double-glycine peptidase domain